MNLPRAIICDIDGCIADHRHRLHYVDAEFYYENIVGAKELYKKVLETWDDQDSGYIYRHRFTDARFSPDWDSFYSAMYKDGVNEWCKHLIRRFTHNLAEIEDDFEVIFITGRPEKYWQITFEWIRDNLGGVYFDSDLLFMRPDYLPDAGHRMADYEKDELVPLRFRDHRPSPVVKKEIFEREIKGKYEVLFAIEDSEKCAQMYRDQGVTVLKVMQ